MAEVKEQYANDLASGTTLATALTDTSGTTVVVASADMLPHVPQFRIRIDTELMLVTGVSGPPYTTLTVQRGIEGSAAATHSAGANVYHILTRGSIIQAGRKYGTIATQATGQSISDSTITPIQFSSTTIDELGAWSSGANTKLTAPATGWYILGGHIKYNDSIGGKRVMDCRVNGGSYPASISQTTDTYLQGPDLVLSVPVYLTASDYMELTTWQHQGSAVTIANGASAWMLQM